MPLILIFDNRTVVFPTSISFVRPIISVNVRTALPEGADNSIEENTDFDNVVAAIATLRRLKDEMVQFGSNSDFSHTTSTNDLASASSVIGTLMAIMHLSKLQISKNMFVLRDYISRLLVLKYTHQHGTPSPASFERFVADNDETHLRVAEKIVVKYFERTVLECSGSEIDI